ncbi:MAG: hypothetical protein U1F35_18190 [Steroidobacteraceae bacterium]
MTMPTAMPGTENACIAAAATRSILPVTAAPASPQGRAAAQHHGQPE